MSKRFNTVLLFLVISVCSFAQQKLGIQLLNDSFDTKWSKGSFYLGSSGSALSNTINTGMFSDFLFRDNFSEKSKSTFLDQSKKYTKLVASANHRIEYKLSNSLGLQVRQSSFVGFRSENAFSHLLLFGNKRFKGERLKTEDLRFLAYSSYAIGLTKKYISHNKKWQVKSGLDVQILGQMNEVNARNMGLYTSATGDEVKADIDQLAISRNQNDVAGIGLNLDLDFKYYLSESSSLSLDFRNLNFNHLLNTELFYLDSNFTFTGVNSFGPRDSIFKSGYLERRINEEIEDGTEKRPFISLPSNICIAYNKSLGQGNIISTTFRTTDLGVFGSSLDVAYLKIFNPNIALKSSIGYGDFSGITWREEFEYAFKKVSVKVDLLNLHAIVLPYRTTSYGAAIGVSSHL